MLPEPHTKVIRLICDIIVKSTVPIRWGLTGSASFSLQGMPVAVHDIDIQTDKAGAYALGRLLQEYEITPVSFSGNEKIRSHYGRFLINGIDVEIMGDIQKFYNGQWEDIVPIDRLLTFVCLNNGMLPVLCLDYEAEAYEKLGRIEKAKQIRDFIDANPVCDIGSA